MNVISMVHENLLIANAVIGESSLPYFCPSSNHTPKRMRVSALD